MTKTKVSTVAIVVLSVLLAAALASTIVLAAFAFSRSATTTITFANGVSLTATGIDKTGVWKSYAVADNATIGTDELTATQRGEMTTGVALSAITVTNNSSTQAIKVAVAVKKTGTTDIYVSGATGNATATKALVDSQATAANFAAGTAGTTAITGATNAAVEGLYWMTFDIAASGNATVVNILNTKYAAADVDGLSGTNFTAAFFIAAVYAGADADTAIENAIKTGDFAAWTAA